MDAKTLSAILGHYSVSFTLDTYAHVLEDHKKEEMDKLSDLYFANTEQKTESFAVIISNTDGVFRAKSADFNDIVVTDKDINTCVNKIKNSIRAHVYFNNVHTAVLPAEIKTSNNEFVVVVTV